MKISNLQSRSTIEMVLMNLTLILFYVLAVTAWHRGRIAAQPQLGLCRPVPRVELCHGGSFYLLLGAPFIALVQVTVYAGAIMVLFLFVIMLLGAEKLPRARCCPGSVRWRLAWRRSCWWRRASCSSNACIPRRSWRLPARTQHHRHPSNPGHGIIQPVPAAF